MNDSLDQIHNDLVCIGQVLCRLELVIVHHFGNPAAQLIVPRKLGTKPFAQASPILNQADKGCSLFFACVPWAWEACCCIFSSFEELLGEHAS